MATDAQSLMTQAQCFSCFGNSMYFLTLMRLALWRQYLLQLNPGATVDPQGLLGLAKCFECYGSNKYALQLMRIAMLAQMASGTSPVNPIASDWALRVVANGGTRPSTQTILAISNFLNSIQSLQSRIWHLNVIAPDSLIAMRTPLIHAYGFDPWVPVTVGAGFAETLDSGGWQGTTDEVNGIVYDTGIFPNLIPSFAIDHGGVSLYAATSVVVTNPPVGNRRNFFDLWPNDGTFSRFHMWDTTHLAISAPPAPSAGFYSGSRTPSGISLYFANSGSPWSLLHSNVNASSTTPSGFTTAFGGVNNFGLFQPSKQKLSFVAVHDDFNSADGQILFNAVQALRVALGGGFA